MVSLSAYYSWLPLSLIVVDLGGNAKVKHGPQYRLELLIALRQVRKFLAADNFVSEAEHRLMQMQERDLLVKLGRLGEVK